MFKKPNRPERQSDMKTKVIAGVSFEISEPFNAGDVLTEATAKALNQLRSENIGNNVREKVKELTEAGKIDEAKALVAEKDAGYEFTLASVAASAKLDPYEREARSLAKEIVKTLLAAKGLKINVAPEGTSKEDWDAKIEANIEKVAAKEDVIKEAKKTVDAKKKRLESLTNASSEGVEV